MFCTLQLHTMTLKMLPTDKFAHFHACRKDVTVEDPDHILIYKPKGKLTGRRSGQVQNRPTQAEADNPKRRQAPGPPWELTGNRS